MGPEGAFHSRNLDGGTDNNSNNTNRFEQAANANKYLVDSTKVSTTALINKNFNLPTTYIF